MKRYFLILIAVFLVADLSAQVIFRNDFIINRKQRKLENLGLTFVSVNLDGRHNWNQLINGRGGKSLVIDLAAIRHRKSEYTYAEIAEKVYTPNIVTGPIVKTVPAFLLLPPPDGRLPFFVFRPFPLVLHSFSE